MDEPTSSLDSGNEDKVMRVISNIRASKTIVMITHRLHLNNYTDSVIFL